MVDESELLRESSRRILNFDPELAKNLDKLRALVSHATLAPTISNVLERVSVNESPAAAFNLELETIVNRVGRPVLEIANDDYVIDGPEAAVWETRLTVPAVHKAMQAVIPSVGRIEVANHPDLTWVGTGWLIAENVIVTNRHVASEFAALSIASGGAKSFVFKRGWPDRNTRMSASVDFRRELKNSSSRAFVIKDVLHVEDDDGPDFAFLRVETTGSAGQLSPFLRPSSERPSAQQYVATIGYPAADSRIPEQDLMSRLFGDKYNVKRMAPGQIQRSADDLVMHDCSTLGGNSGSPIIDLATGEVLGLHFSGVFLKENRGVMIEYVTNRLSKVLDPQRFRERKDTPLSTPKPDTSSSTVNDHSAGISITIPLRINVSLGSPITEDRSQ